MRIGIDSRKSLCIGGSGKKGMEVGFVKLVAAGVKAGSVERTSTQIFTLLYVKIPRSDIDQMSSSSN